MQCYVVGGSVRDVIFGVEPKDIDFVWVGATAQDMIDKGFVPLSSSFPVFLDDQKNEHALARTERKVGVGYGGFECSFSPDTTIEEDLMRRDLTMNAMAVKVEDWQTFTKTKQMSLVVDPYNGKKDISARVLKHVSDAFAEDPLRVLRVSRFAARYACTVHPNTLDLMKSIVCELEHIPHDRIWIEFEKGLMEDLPLHMIETLKECGAFDIDHLKPYAACDVTRMKYVTPATPLHVRSSLLMQGFADGDYSRCRIPGHLAKISKTCNAHIDNIWKYASLPENERLNMITRLQVFGDMALLNQFLDVVKLWDLWRLDILGIHYVSPLVRRMFLTDIDKAKAVDCAAIASQFTNGADIKQAIIDARLDVMRANMKRNRR